MSELLEQQINSLKPGHFHVLYWTAIAEEKNMLYNITNAFDDLKYVKETRTKQSAVSYVEALEVLCFVKVNGESNRKNITITNYGAQALAYLVSNKVYKIKKSLFLEVTK